jgi:hypothetical protein
MTPAVQTTGAAGAVNACASVDSTAASVPEASLLPEPNAVPADPLMCIALLLNKGRGAGLKNALGDIRTEQNHKARMRKLEHAALREAREAKDEGGFWRDISKKCGTVGKLAAVGGSVALAAGTGGAATPAVVLAWSGAGLSAASFVQGETHALQALGVDDKWASGIELGMGVAGMVCCGGAGWAGAEQASEVLATTERVAIGIGGVAQAASGVATLRSAQHQHREETFMSDALDAQLDAERMQRKIMRLISEVEGSEESDRNVMASLRGAIDARGEASLAASGRV